ncbi:hypothetical protein ZIOFF_009827 [Zingiber officinale]|uniref:Eukaryotic translation initiation factor 3 subunit H n=2 Tax=Magnoliopsida TaxID=3398 RepID=A0A8J5LJN4_ZINOF|nr:hypothetical protein ZIOFF_009827 [Zingiber officinale]
MSMGRSFLQAAATSEEVAPPLRVVQIEGLLKISILTSNCRSLKTWVIAMNMARTLERKHCFHQGRGLLCTNWGGTTTKLNISSGCPPLAKIKTMGDISKETPPAAFFKHLTHAEMAEWRAKGLCFNCDESYSIGYKYKRLFWIEVPDDDREGEEEGEAVLKIIKHCNEFLPSLVTGQLLGLDVGSVLEVTNCFPFPIREEDEEIEADGANYQLEMMRCLREVNVDNNTVGWYQSTLMGSFQTVELIETFMNYQDGKEEEAGRKGGNILEMLKRWKKLGWNLRQGGSLSGACDGGGSLTELVKDEEALAEFTMKEQACAKLVMEEDQIEFAMRVRLAEMDMHNKPQISMAFKTIFAFKTMENIRRCVCIVYDPSRSAQGVLALKALKLTDSFMDLYRNNNFTGEKLREKNLSWVDIFEEIPVSCSSLEATIPYMLLLIKVSNSALASAFMTELEPELPVKQCDYDRLKLSTAPYMERNLEFLIDCMEDLSAEQNKFQYYYRNLSRQQAQQQTWLQKRRVENMARKAAGEEPLPEEDPANPIFKPILEPSRVDSYLITNQISNYCNQINGVATQSFNRLYLMKALHED